MNANSKPLYQPWSEDQFRACIDVQTMLPVQRWMYRTLCQSAFVESTRPYLPDDDSQLWKMAGCESQKQWNQNKREVRAAFTPVVVDGRNLLSRERIVKDWERLTERREALAEFGRKGGKAKKTKLPEGSKAEEVKEGSIVSKEKEVSNLAKAEPSQSLAQAKPELPVSFSSPSDTGKDLAGLTQRLAKKRSKSATFGKMAMKELRAAISQIQATEEELRAIIPDRVDRMNDFHLNQAGSIIASELVEMVQIKRDAEKAKAEANRREQEMSAEADRKAEAHRQELARTKPERIEHNPDDMFCCCSDCNPKQQPSQR